MGLTIHYSGMLRNPNQIHDLVTEAIDISKSMRWTYDLIDPIPDIPIQGVLVAPEKSEPLWLTFHKEGFMCSPLLYSYVQEATGESISAEAENWLFTKTQYAGVEAHMAMIRFMRYLSEKYFEHFEMHDESQFWETNDEAICRKRFGEYERIMDMMGEALDQLEMDPDESPESVADKIEGILKERYGKWEKG